MDLLALLGNAAQSLGAHRAASETASHNLANASTPGYARQRADLAAVTVADRVRGAFIGRGAELAGVSQARDRFVELQLPEALSRQAKSDAQAQALTQVTALDASAPFAVGQALSAFFSALRASAQNAGDASLRQAVVGAAEDLATSFGRTASGLAAARDGVDAKLEAAVGEVNPLAAQLASLNRSIREARASGAEPNDLLDARLRLQDRLEELTGATPVPDADGNVSLVLSGGQALVSGDRAATLSLQKDASNGGHLSVWLTPEGGTPRAASVAGGTVGGLLLARDGALKDAQTALDALAYDVASALNAVHRAGTGLDGVSGRDLFTPPAAVAGAAAGLSVSAAVRADPRALAAASSSGTLPGDGSNLQALVAVESKALSSGFDAQGTLSKLTASFGSAARTAQAFAEQDGAMLDHLSQVREAQSGVSVDEEMVRLTQAERAYEAVLKVIQTGDQMLDTLMKLR